MELKGEKQNQILQTKVYRNVEKKKKINTERKGKFKSQPSDKKRKISEYHTDKKLEITGTQWKSKWNYK